MSLSLVPMLMAGQSIASEARQALRENRLEKAAELLCWSTDLHARKSTISSMSRLVKRCV